MNDIREMCRAAPTLMVSWARCSQFPSSSG